MCATVYRDFSDGSGSSVGRLPHAGVVACALCTDRQDMGVSFSILLHLILFGTAGVECISSGPGLG